MEVEQLRQRSHSKNQCIPYTAPFTASQQYKHNYTANMLCQCYIMATGDTLQMMLLHKKAAAAVIQICNLFTSTVDGSIAALSTICTVHNDSHTLQSSFLSISLSSILRAALSLALWHLSHETTRNHCSRPPDEEQANKQTHNLHGSSGTTQALHSAGWVRLFQRAVDPVRVRKHLSDPAELHHFPI